MESVATLAAYEIAHLTQIGGEHFKNAEVEKAQQAFESAFKKSQQLGDGVTERTCALNLGAVYIACRDTQRGLNMLQRAIPPNNQRDNKSNADLYYNFALANELLKNEVEAAKYYELALEEYHLEKDNCAMEADTAVKVAKLYSSLGNPLQASRSYGIAAQAYGKVEEIEEQAVCLNKEAIQFCRAQKPEQAVDVSDNCMILCQKLPQSPAVGKLYSDLGLIYSQCGDFSKAATCFELALPLSRAPGGDKPLQVVVLQNLGAIYNSLGDYQRSLPFHEAAQSLYAEIGNRGNQGKCFANLAFAYSQLGDLEGAGECYLHALQASKDTGDRRSEWQAMEGMAAVAFHENNITRTIRYYKMALSTLATSGENQPQAQERIVGKLTHALKSQMTIDDPKSVGSKATQRPLLGQVDPRAFPSPEDQQKILALRSQSSITRSNSDPRSADVPDTSTPPVRRKSTRRPERKSQSNYKGLELGEEAGKRRPWQPLLRKESYDSEGEWRSKMKDAVRSNKGLHKQQYQEKLYPEGNSSDEDDDEQMDRKLAQQEKYIKLMQNTKLRRKLQETDSDTTETDSRPMSRNSPLDGQPRGVDTRPAVQQQRDHGAVVTRPAVQQQREHAGVVTGAAVQQQRDHGAVVTRPAVQQQREHAGIVTGAGVQQQKGQAHDDQESASQIQNYEAQLSRIQEDDSESETESETEIDSGSDADQRTGTIGGWGMAPRPPVEAQSSARSRDPTYEEVQLHPESSQRPQVARAHSSNYFREGNLEGDKQKDEYQNKGGSRTKESIPLMDDPNYMTIRPLGQPVATGDTARAASSHISGQPAQDHVRYPTTPPPPLPPRNPHTSGASHHQPDHKEYDQENVGQKSTDPPLTKNNTKDKSSSNTCTVM